MWIKKVIVITHTMDEPTLATYLSQHLDTLVDSPFYCPYNLHKYRQTSALLRACGHNTESLDEAIEATSTSIQELKAAQESAIFKFRNEGVCFIVDTEKAKELEMAHLQ